MKRVPSNGSRPASANKKSVPVAADKIARRGGRPSRTEAERLGTRILDAATALFFSAGYGATTIEAVAQRARISKRTFYHRFDDKPALFSAVVHRTIERLRPPPNVPLLEGANLEETLRHLAALILGAALSRPAIALHRLIVSESARFPKLAAVVQREGGSREAIALISGVLERAHGAGQLTLDAPVFAAQQFLHMVIAGPQSRAVGLGTPMSTAEQDAWARDAVNLFVNGCRNWTPQTPSVRTSSRAARRHPPSS